MPSAKYSWSLSPERFSIGSTTRDLFRIGLFVGVDRMYLTVTSIKLATMAKKPINIAKRLVDDCLRVIARSAAVPEAARSNCRDVVYSTGTSPGSSTAYVVVEAGKFTHSTS